MNRTLSPFAALMAAGAFIAAAALVAVACDPHVALALAQHAFESTRDARFVLLAAGPLMTFKVREGFVSTVYTFTEIGGREERRQLDTYGGETVRYDADQAVLNLHKLEPADKASTEFMNSRHAIAEQPTSPAGVSEQVATAVADALAAFKAGLVAAGVFGPKPDASASGAPSGSSKNLI